MNTTSYPCLRPSEYGIARTGDGLLQCGGTMLFHSTIHDYDGRMWWHTFVCTKCKRTGYEPIAADSKRAKELSA